jgi:sugar phosphate isomerase/epimerase
MHTRTGNFPIGFRRLWMKWHKDTKGILEWAKKNKLSVIDLGQDGDKSGKKALEAGLKLGSIDLLEWQKLISANASTRKQAVENNIKYIKKCAKLGPINYFIAMIPEDPKLSRKENFGYMVDSFKKLAPVLEDTGGRVVVEGWPGPGVLVTTPETYRAFFNEVPSEVMGINFDPSHLIRMGIDPHRFLNEFKSKVFHVHGKDCEINFDNLYEYGNELPATFKDAIPFGNQHWRYTIPGHGITRWVDVLKTLRESGYTGAISIELEDANYNGTEAGEKLGILQGTQFLSGC